MADATGSSRAQEEGRTPPRGEAGPGDGPSMERLRARGREVRDEGRALADATQGLVSEVSELAREQVEERPYWMLGAAFALGWVLGGGVPPRAVRMAGDVATRTALAALAARVVEAVAHHSASGPDASGVDEG